MEIFSAAKVMGFNNETLQNIQMQHFTTFSYLHVGGLPIKPTYRDSSDLPSRGI